MAPVRSSPILLLPSVLLLSLLCGCGGGSGASGPIDPSEGGSSDAGSPDASQIIVVDRDAQSGDHPGAQDARAPSMDAKAPVGDAGSDAHGLDGGDVVDSAFMADALAPEAGAPTCAPGWADCDGNPDDGCETDLTQPGHCGSCTTACPASDPVCSGSGSSYACVTGCPSGTPTRCSGSCVDVQSDDSNCGGCGQACQGGEHCVAGTCECTGGQHLCGSPAACVDETVSACGPSCQVCTAPAYATASCSGSACQWACNAGYTGCPTANPTACDALGSDSNNCGACGHVCMGGETCQWGACACPLGEVLCGGTCVDEANDGNNCAACGHSCLGGACSGGQCQPITLTTGGSGAITLDASNVYFVGGTELYSCAKTGCGSATTLVSASYDISGVLWDPGIGYGPRLYASLQIHDVVGVFDTSGITVGATTVQLPMGLASDASNVYIGTGVGTIVAGAKTFGDFSPKTIATGLPGYVLPVAVDTSTSAVYGGVRMDSGSIVRVPTTSEGAFETFISNQPNPASIVIAAGNVYWVDSGTSSNGYLDSAAYMCPTGDSCSSSTLLLSGGSCASMTADASFIYFDCSTTLFRCPLSGCRSNPTHLASAPMAMGATLANDATAIYWVAMSGAIMKLAK